LHTFACVATQPQWSPALPGNVSPAILGADITHLSLISVNYV